MTAKLALDEGSMIAMPPSSSQLRRARLDRMRAGRAPAVEGPGQPGPSAERLTRSATEPARKAHERTASLAADLGGRVMDGPDGPVVVLEHSVPMSARTDRLAALPEPVDPSRPLLFLDTETTGLGTAAGTLPFMIGLGAWQDERFVVRQLILADHVDEPALLTLLAESIPPDACLVTYNGRTFDWPLLVSRYRLHGRPPPPHAAHLDLLPLARQLWKHRLPDARLASVEAGVAGVRRAHDLPGAFIPARYLDYLRSRHGALLREVVEHNRQDVVSMALLMRVLVDELLPAAGGARAADGATGTNAGTVRAGDLGGLGRAFARRRRNREALACFEGALERIGAPWDATRYEAIAIDRARTLTRLGMREEAEGAWRAIALEGGRMAALAWLQVAKHREHDAADFSAALAVTERARVLAERSRLFGHRDHLVERDLPRRVQRLRRRLSTARTA